MRRTLVAAGFAVLSLLVACSSGEVGTGGANGSVELTLTDAGIEDLARFEVDVAGLVFHKLGGASVSVLPRTTRVDFVELQEFAELVGRGTLEAGRYTRVTMTLDFATAEALIVGAASPASIVRADGSVLNGELAIDVDFPVGRRPEVVPSRRHVIQLDLDLSQAIEVDTAANRLTFRPVLDAEFDPTDPKPARTRGELASVDTGRSTFVVRRVDADRARIAELTVATSDQTVFQISGENYRGAFGIQALAALPADSRVFVQGVLDPSLPGIRAVAVESGAGVPGSGQDQVEGWIIGRRAGAGVDAELTVLGRSVAAGTGTRRWFTQFTVRVTYAGTRVLRRGMSSPESTDALTVGQRIWAFGELTDTVLEAGPVETGIVRMLPTTVLGRANAASANGLLALDVVRIGGVGIGQFNFDVAGLVEVDPSAFTVDVRGIDLAGMEAQAKVAATGWMNPVAVAGDEDFAAVRVVDRTGVGDLLLALWLPADAASSVVVGGDGLSLAVDQAAVGVILDGFGGRVLEPLPAPVVRPRADTGAWRITQGRSVTVHRSFAEFVADLGLRMTAGANIVAVKALGGDEPSTQVLTAIAIGVDLL